MVAGEDALAQVRGGFLGLALGYGKGLLGLVFGHFVGMVVPVEMCEAFQVGGGPSVFALEEFVDFALGRRPSVYGCGVVVFRLADVGAGGSEPVLYSG